MKAQRKRPVPRIRKLYWDLDDELQLWHNSSERTGDDRRIPVIIVPLVDGLEERDVRAALFDLQIRAVSK
jgi:hypothetical protein